MAVPDYQSFMHPLLALLADGQTRKMRDIYAAMAEQFRLTEAELAEMLPSGRQSTFMDRVGWAKTYLVKAGALVSPQRAMVGIAPRGLELLQRFPERVTAKDLMQFDEFMAFQQVRPGGMRVTDAESAVLEAAADHPETLSPEEEMAQLFTQLNGNLAAELLEQARNLTPAQFERLVVEVLVAMGYGGSVRDAGQALGRSGDNGIDGLIKQDPLGLDRIYLQAKRWQDTVHSPEIRTFSGSLTYHKAAKGVFITTSNFSDGARRTAQQIGNIILIDGDTLARLMIDYGVGVITRETYRIRRVDSEYFEEL